MKPFAPRLAAYLGRHVLLATLATGAVLLGFVSVIDFVTELRDVGKESYTLSHAMLYVLLTMPTRSYEVFPTVAVIGSLLGLGGLAARSELTVMRAVGLSKLQMGMAALLPLGVLTLLMVINIETAGPAGQQRAEELANSKNAHMIMARYSGLWAREGDLFLNARGNSGERTENGRTWVELEDVRLYQFDDKGRLQSLAHARKAEHSANGWILRDVERTHFLPRSVTVDHIVSERWKTEIDDATLAAQLARPRYLTSAELRTNIDYLKRNRLDAVKFESAYWSHWFYPYNVIVLCLATLPFAFGSLRSGGFGKRLFIGILVGIGALLLQRMCVDLADVYRFDVRLGYLFPPLLIWGLCWGVLAKRI
ncbi:MAG TPA: LPS export ABC transporter permease LptG [Rhizobacter sp.]|nr:LPS export ABC transporter permease LptG [Rhizobacter sp.]